MFKKEIEKQRRKGKRNSLQGRENKEGEVPGSHREKSLTKRDQ